MRSKHYVGLFLFVVVGVSATGMLANLFDGAKAGDPPVEAPKPMAPNPFALPPLPGLAPLEPPPKKKAELPAPVQPESVQPESVLPPPILPVGRKKEAEQPKQPAPAQLDELPPLVPPPPPIPGLEEKKAPVPQIDPLPPIVLEEKPVASPPEPKKDGIPPLPGVDPSLPPPLAPLPGLELPKLAPAPKAPVVAEPKVAPLPAPAPKNDEPPPTSTPPPMLTPPAPPAPNLNPLPPIVNEPKGTPPNVGIAEKPPQAPPSFNQVVKSKGSPWTLLVAMTEDGTIVTATINNKYAFQIKCQNAELLSAKGTFEASGKVTFQSEGFEGQCDRFSITLADDRVVLEGSAEVRVQSKGTRRYNSSGSEEASPQVEMKGQRLDLRVGELMPKVTQNGGGVGAATFPAEIRLASFSRVRLAASILPDRIWSDMGTLRATDLQHQGRPVWSLVNAEGRAMIHLTTAAGKSLQTYEGRTIALGGTAIENAPMGTLMLATDIMIP